MPVLDALRLPFVASTLQIIQYSSISCFERKKTSQSIIWNEQQERKRFQF